MTPLYYVKVDMPELKAGSVSWFHNSKAPTLILAGEIEPFDPENKKHAAALRAQEKASEERRLAGEAELREERENPVAYRAKVLARRREHEKAMLKHLGAQRRQLEQQRAAAESAR